MGRRALDLRNRRFGRLVAISRMPNQGRNTMWLCRCDCGKLSAVTTSNLMTCTQSCGCLRSDTMRARAHAWNEARSHEREMTA